MATKQERLYKHLQNLDLFSAEIWSPGWEAKAIYLDQYFIERELADKRLQTWEQLHQALQQLEWITPFGEDEGYCFLCSSWQHHGHRDDCEIKAVLEAAKEEQEDA